VLIPLLIEEEVCDDADEGVEQEGVDCNSYNQE